MKTLMSVNKVAELFGVARATIYEWCSERKIPFIKIGSRNMFDQEEISRWLDDRRISTAGFTAQGGAQGDIQSVHAANSEEES